MPEKHLLKHYFMFTLWHPAVHSCSCCPMDKILDQQVFEMQSKYCVIKLPHALFSLMRGSGMAGQCGDGEGAVSG